MMTTRSDVILLEALKNSCKKYTRLWAGGSPHTSTCDLPRSLYSPSNADRLASMVLSFETCVGMRIMDAVIITMMVTFP